MVNNNRRLTNNDQPMTGIRYIEHLNRNWTNFCGSEKPRRD